MLQKAQVISVYSVQCFHFHFYTCAIQSVSISRWCPINATFLGLWRPQSGVRQVSSSSCKKLQDSVVACNRSRQTTAGELLSHPTAGINVPKSRNLRDQLHASEAHHHQLRSPICAAQTKISSEEFSDFAADILSFNQCPQTPYFRPQWRTRTQLRACH